MYEIEIKAHIYDRNAVKNALASFASYEGKIEKHDSYYRYKNYITARIRKETLIQADPHTKIFLTYKRKELRTLPDGTVTEVNEENECTLSDASTIEKLFSAIGFTRAYTKEKFAESWYATTPAGKAHIELCEVPPIGDFLEIEIMAHNNDNSTVDATRKELYKLLEKCGVDKADIEPRFYSELLRK